MLFNKTNEYEGTVVATSMYRVAHQLKAIVFINHVIMLAGCPRSACSIEQWGEAFEIRKGIVGPGGGGTGKWRRYLKGRLPRGKLLNALIDEFPVLAQVLNNPLWEVLRELEEADDHGRSLVRRLKMDGTPLSVRRLKRLQRRISTADWQDLGFWLVILATEPTQNRPVLAFMQTRFVSYLFLISVQPCFVGAETLLYPLLDQHFREGHLALVERWPGNNRLFIRCLRRLQRLPRSAVLKAGIEGDGHIGFFIADPEGAQWASSGYGFYWDLNWNRVALTPKEKRFLWPPLMIGLEKIPEGVKRPGARVRKTKAV
jgi:hypothetical protein